ncbi:MAG: hypothetical protein UW34_C0014G0002 [Parcubacteria group bacterium GW2011_GWA2_44_15]|nr:MAG: hypothetical protein UW34_C0014G0002 [Parcubacteria group bacterium GW2011_GWA2_44_15]
MLIIALRALKDKKIFLLSFVLGGIGMAWMYAALFPTIAKLSEPYNKILETFPKSLLQAFGFEGAFTGFESYMSAEHFGFVWPIMLIFLIASFAGASISREIEKGTMEILLSLPVSRVKIFFGKYLSGIAALCVFVTFSVLAIIPLAEAYNINYVVSHFFTMSLLGFLFGWAIFGLSVLFSAIFSDKSKVYMATGGIMIGMYVIRIVSILSDKLDKLKYFSFFHYYNAPDALSKNSIAPETFIVFISVAVITTILAAVWFSKRDAAV